MSAPLRPDGIKGVGHKTGDCSHGLSNHPADNDVCVLGVWKHALCRVIDAKVSSSVDDNALY